MKKRFEKTIRIVIILGAIIGLALLAILYYNMELVSVKVALIGGAIGAFFGLLLKEITGP